VVVGDGVAASDDRSPSSVVVFGVVALGVVLVGVVVGITSMICDEVLVVKVERE